MFSYISHYNSRSRHARVKHSINRLFLSMRTHILAIDIFDLPLMVLEIIEVKSSRGVRSLTRVFLY